MTNALRRRVAHILGTGLALLLLTQVATAAIGPGNKERARNVPTKAPLAVVGGHRTVTQLDPVTLAPTKTGAVLGEYHRTYSFSPDRSKVAFGISVDGGPGVAGRIGIRLVNARSAEETGDIATGVYAAAVAWLEPARMVAVLGDSFICSFPCEGIEEPNYSAAITVNPSTGETLTNSRIPHLCDASEIRGRALLSLSERRLSIVESDGKVETVELPQPFASCGDLATSLTDEAFVISDDGAVLAQVGLESSQLTVHDLPEARRIREAIALAPNRVVLARQAGGVDLFDMGTGRLRTIDSSARGVRISGQHLLVFGKRIGVRAYDRDGRRLFSALRGNDIADLGVVGGFAYAIGKDGVAVVNVRSGKVVDRSPTRFRGDLLAERSAQ